VAKATVLDHALKMKKQQEKPSTKTSKRLAASRHRTGSSIDFQKRFFEQERELRAAEFKVELQKVQIEELKRDCARLRSGRSANEDILHAEIHKRDVEIVALNLKLETANKQLEWFRNNKFGSSSEKSKEQNQPNKDTDTEEKTKKTRGQKPGSKGHGRNKNSETDTQVKYLEIPGCACDSCGQPYRLMARTEASPLTEIEIDIVRTVFQRCIYVSRCTCEGRKIKVAKPPAKLFPRTEIGNTLWVWLLVQKFLHGMPQNRILKQLSLWGLSVPAGTVTGGYKFINELLEPLVEAVEDRCKGANLWNADETTWRVFGESKQRWWFWLIACDDAVVYLLDPSRSNKVPNEFFAGSAGILMSDRFSSYKGMQASVRKAWCWAHMRRDFLNIYNGIPKLKTWAKAWLLDISQLYVFHHEHFSLWKQGITEGDKWEQSSLTLASHVNKLQQKWYQEVSKTGLHKEQSKVLRSLKRHWKGLTIFLEDPRIPLDNNRAERLLRNPVILRKNSFGSGAAWAGRFAAKIFSLIQTWLLNGLDPQALLLDYFNECSKTPGKPPPNIEAFLPWKMSAERKNQFALPSSYKKPG
jgi:transposase